MSTITLKRIGAAQQFGGTPYGNVTTHHAVLETNAAGAVVGSNSAAAVAIADVVRIAILPAGFQLHDALAAVSDAFTAASTAKIGFVYADGVDDAAVPQDDDYFFAALAMNAAGRTRANNNAVRPVTLPKDAYLILTWAGAASADAGRLDLLIQGIDRGPA